MNMSTLDSNSILSGVEASPKLDIPYPLNTSYPTNRMVQALFSTRISYLGNENKFLEHFIGK